MTNIHDDDDTVITKEDAKLSTFDSAEYIVSKEDRQLYLNISLKEEDGLEVTLHSIGSTLGVLLRAQALSRLARKTKIDRSDLCEILLGEGNPTPEILTKIAEALGLKMPAEFNEKFGLKPEKTVKTSISYTQHKHTEQPHVSL
ncbi:MAG: helix-turn-helix domain-containing protein [Acetobacter sp.]|nr:helix-turn-helix domain-containing protein [Acetobacter sp.]